MTNSASTYVFVGPQTESLRRLVIALRERQINARLLSDEIPLGSTIFEGMKSAIDGAAGVVGVYDRNAASANLSFELGVAHALGKPVLLLNPEGRILPLNLAQLFVVNSDLSNVDSIELAIREMRSPKKTVKVEISGTKGRPLTDKSDDFLQRFVQLNALDARSGSWHQQFEDLIADAIDASGAEVVIRQAGRADYQFDLGVWSDDLATIAANPLLVEVKRSIDSRRLEDLVKSASELQAGSALLVVTAARVSPGTRAKLQWPVALVNAEDLLREMQFKSFASVVRDLRNAAVHGSIRP